MLSAKQVAPGQTGEIQVSVNTEGVSAINKSVTVTTNDPRNLEIVLSITATVEPEFILSERSINLGNVSKDREASKEIFITIAADRQIKLLSVESTEASFSPRLESVPESAGKKTKLVVQMKPDAKDGYHFGSLVIKTSSPLTPELKIPVRGMVVAGQNN